MELATKSQEMMEAFTNGREEPAALVALGTGQMQIEQKPIGAIKVAVERDEAKVLQRLRVFAAAAGEEFYYRFPVKTKDGQDWIEGPSIKCALSVARAYGNCDVDVRTQDTGDSWVFYARFVDFETGFSLTRAFQQRKSQKTMKTDNARALDIVFQIGQSKSIRNVICNALGMFTDFAFMEARQAIVEKVGKSIEQYRAKVVSRLADLKIETNRVESVIGRPVGKWLAPDIARAIAEIQAINDGMASADDLYPLLVDEKRPERGDFVDATQAASTKPPAAKVEPKQPTPAELAAAAEKAAKEAEEKEAVEREADRLQREQDGEQVIVEEKEEEEQTPQAEGDDWDGYMKMMLAELNAQKTAKDVAATSATFRDAVLGAVERREITEDRGNALLNLWNPAVEVQSKQMPVASPTPPKPKGK